MNKEIVVDIKTQPGILNIKLVDEEPVITEWQDIPQIGQVCDIYEQNKAKERITLNNSPYYYTDWI